MNTPADAIRISSMNFAWGADAAPLLHIDSFVLKQGEKVFLSGPSGSGKSTFLSLIAGVADATSGQVEVAGTNLATLGHAHRDRFRADHIGMIFQVFNLLPWQSALQNVLLPCKFSRRRRERAGPDPTGSAIRLLAGLGLERRELISAPAMTLSIGQQQRVAAARALIGAPDLILADEPTSALDSETKTIFVDLLLQECTAAGSALLFVSHDRSLAPHFDREMCMQDLSSQVASC